MSTTIDYVRAAIRVHIRDLDPRDYVVPTEALDLEIISKSQEMTAQALPGLSWSSAALSLSAGASDASFSAQDRMAVVSIKCVQTGQIIPKLPREMVESRRQTSGSQPTGQPDGYYLIEDETNLLTARFVPNADQAYTFDVLMSNTPSSGVSSVYGAIPDSTVIPWSELMSRAIEKSVAITLVSKMTRNHAERLGINPGVIEQWSRDVENLLRAEKRRQSRRFLGGYLVPAVGP